MAGGIAGCSEEFFRIVPEAIQFLLRRRARNRILDIHV